MSTIIGRTKELKILQRLLESPRSEFLAIYGRRRVGKTYLIHEFFKDKGFYFAITGSANSNKKIQIKKFYRELASAFPHIDKTYEPKDWDDALYLLKDAITTIDPSKRVILFFDELPWLATNRSGFLPALEYIWNQFLSKMQNVKLIVCGSAANWIIKKIINNKNGLYGRLSEVIKLNAFTIEETANFLTAQNVKLSQKQIIELYMCMGGIAKYLTYVNPGESAAQVINRLCFTPQGQLVNEFTNLYQSLFDDSHKHIQIIKELAQHKSGIPQKLLLSKVELASGGQFSSILEELQESGFISMNPEYKKKTRDKRIWLIDEYSYFYLTWMDTIKNSIVMGNDPNYWLKMQNDPQWKIWSGYAFESICLKHIMQIKRALGIEAILSTESQWTYKSKNKNEEGAQIDLVIDRKDDCINLCEIKFYNGKFIIDKSYAKILDRKIQIFREQTKTKKTIFLTFITPFGLHQNEHSTELVHSELTLEDLF